MLRKYPERYTLTDWVAPMLNMFEGSNFYLENKLLIGHVSLGYISSACSLLLGVFQADPNIVAFFIDIIPKVVKILHKLAILKECS